MKLVFEAFILRVACEPCKTDSNYHNEGLTQIDILKALRRINQVFQHYAIQ